MAVTRRWLWVGGWTLAACCSMAMAQTYYKWTDDQGIVHFADMPPPEPERVEERHLAAPPAVKPREAQAPAAAETSKSETQAPPAIPGKGPARVIVISRKGPRTGPSTMHIVGEVKNVGGADAQRVAVTVSAVDSTAGTPCLSEEVTVNPPTLRPGESGSFDVDVDSPCLLGQTNVDVAPVWD